MSGGSAIDAATKRLALALDALEAALERRRESDRGEETLAAQLQALGSDRSRLAADLDAQAARAFEVPIRSCGQVRIGTSNRRH